MTSKNPAPETPESDPLEALADPQEISVDDEIDPRIKAFVHAGLKRTEAAPRKWLVVELPETDLARVVRDAKAYAREHGMTFRVKGSPLYVNRLIYRVTLRTVREPE